MGFDFSLPIDSCFYCNKKAEIVYVAKSIIGSKVRLFCKECHKNYIRVKDDLNANRV